ncbi:hypothetical protein KI387_041497 [Taxus chinensis]|uniref:Fe2OG dioxygenase domain-containing protein n=1 Tax=Taxus chinensis TaxID=29808 RepID=A0AA38CBP3_TAXCH|nr:hypothetical protein KI387_041497 [Taxus chinensis]
MFNSALAFDPSDGTSKRLSVPIVQALASHLPDTIPQRYIRSEKERPNTCPSNHLDIPIIDLGMFLGDSDLCRKKEMKKLEIASQQWGFFQDVAGHFSVLHVVFICYIPPTVLYYHCRQFLCDVLWAVNHGIPGSLMERMKETAREFFELPLEEKLKYEAQEHEGYGKASVFLDNQKLDWSDIMHLTTLPPESRKMNFWPTWPVDFRATVDEYVSETQKLSNTVLCLLSEIAGLKPDSFLHMYGKISQLMTWHYYPPCPRPDLVLGLSPHSDGSGLSVLLQDDETVGLQICKEGAWIPIQPIPGALVINIGDMLEVMSNGRYKSVEHRAVTNIDRDRISIAMFYDPGGETEVGPAPELIDELNPCQYRRFNRAEYMRHYFGYRHNGKKAIEFAKIES